MLISTPPISPRSKAKTVSQPMHRPLQESWQVEGESYSSTSELLQNVGLVENLPLTYRFQTEEPVKPYSSAERLANTVGHGLMFAGGGAAAGATLGLGLSFFGALASIVAAPLGGGRVEQVPNWLMWGPTLVGAGLAGATGLVFGFGAKAPQKPEVQVPGLLTKTATETVFFPQGRVDKRVDLSKYSQAAIPALSPAEPAEPPSRGDRIGGAVLGAALVPVSLFPLFGPFAAPYTGIRLGTRLGGRTVFGPVLGAVAGVAATTSIWASVAHATNGGSKLPILGVTAALAAAGSTLFHHLDESNKALGEHRKYGAQWWNQAGVADSVNKTP